MSVGLTRPSSSCKTKRELNRYLQISATICSTREKRSEADATGVRTCEGILTSHGFGGPLRAKRRGRRNCVGFKGKYKREVEVQIRGEDEAIITGTTAVVKCQRGRT